MNVNKVVLIGRLTRDPQAKTFPSGGSLTNFGMATDRFFTDKQGQKQKQTEFHNIVAFGKLADITSKYLAKGSLVFIEGRLRTRSWQDNAGNQRYRTEIVAERIQLGPKQTNRPMPVAQEELPHNAPQEEIPIIEEEEIDIKDIPF